MRFYLRNFITLLLQLIKIRERGKMVQGWNFNCNLVSSTYAKSALCNFNFKFLNITNVKGLLPSYQELKGKYPGYCFWMITCFYGTMLHWRHNHINRGTRTEYSVNAMQQLKRFLLLGIKRKISSFFYLSYNTCWYNDFIDCCRFFARKVFISFVSGGLCLLDFEASSQV